MKKFVKRLKELRKEAGYSQARLANILSVTQQAVGKWEKEIAEPNMDMLIRLADLFNVSIDYLIGYSVY